MQLTAAGVTGKASTRAGSLPLSLLAAPLNFHILEALASKPSSLGSLRRAGGSPPTTTMQRHLATLARAGVLERTGTDSAGAAVYRLTPVGHGLLAVAAVLEEWLAAAPGDPAALGTADGARTVMALVDGWSAGIVRILAASPRGLSELNRIVRGVSAAALGDCLRAMHLAGLVERAPEPEPPPRYLPTPWLRQAIAPLSAAALWEREAGLDAAGPISRLEVEAAFLLTLPLVRLPAQVNGTCRLAVELPASTGRPAGALVEVEQGRIVSCVTTIQRPAEGWVSGPPAAWLDAVIHGESESLEVGVNDHLAHVLLNALHLALFSPSLD